MRYMCKDKLVPNRLGNICLECIRAVQTQMNKSNQVDAVVNGFDTESDLYHFFIKQRSQHVQEFPSASGMRQGYSQSCFGTVSSSQHQINV